MRPAHRVRIRQPLSVGEQNTLAAYATTYGLRANKLDNPEAAATAAGWGGNAGAVVARVTTPSPLLFGPASVKVDLPNVGGAGVFVQASTPARVPVAGGISHAFSIHVDGTGAVGKQLRLVPHYYINPGSAGAPDFIDNGPAVALVAGWQRLSFVSVVPPTAGYALLALYTTAAQGTFTIYVVGAQIEDAGGQGSTGAFFGRVGLYNKDPYEYQPWLDRVSGRSATCDFLTRDVRAGNLTLELGDARINGSQTQRVVTAKIGNAAGVPQLGGCLTELDFTEDLTAPVVTWERWGTGRIDDTSAPDGATIGLDLVDLAQELGEADCFVTTTPHTSVTYAVEPQAWPVGLGTAYANFPTAPIMAGAVAAAPTGGGQMIQLGNASRGARANIIGETLLRAGLVLGYADGLPAGRIHYADSVRARVKQTSGGGAGTIAEYAVGGVVANMARDGKTLPWNRDGVDGFEILAIYLRALPGGTAVPGNGTSVEVALLTQGLEPTEQTPLLLNDVHPATVLADALDGKFGRLSTAGAVTRSYPREPASFAALAADVSFDQLRFVKTKRQSIESFLKEVCLQSGLGWRENEYGQVVLLDLRPPTTLAGVPLLTDADKASIASWVHHRQGAVGQLELVMYVDRPISLTEGTLDAGFLTVPSDALLKSLDRPIQVLDLGRLDLGEKPFRVDATGIRAGLGEVTNGVDREVYLRGRLLRLTEHFRQPYGYGPQETTVELARNATTKGLREGDLIRYDWSEVPNPATNQRGGERVGRILERNEDPFSRLPRARVLDLGPNVTLVVPTVGALAAQTGNTKNGLTVTITVNASADPVAVEVAVTDPTVPDVDSVPANAWVRVARLTATTALTISPLPSGKRIWPRARSEVGPTSPSKVPSAWAYATGADFLDLAALSAPTGLATSLVTERGALLTWNLGGDTTSERLVYLASPSSDPLPAAATHRLLPGTARFIVSPTTAGQTYKAAVAVTDAGGGISPLSGAVTWTATGSPATCPMPLSLSVVGVP